MVKVPHSKHFTGHFMKKILPIHLTYACQSGMKTTCMGMQLAVATTEATDPTRVRNPFRTTANVTELSSMRLRGEARGVTEEVRAGEIVEDVSARDRARQTMEPIGSRSHREGGMKYGCQEESC